MTAPRPYPTLKPPPTQRLGVAYLTPLLAPLPVGTRIPQPEPGQDTIDYFLRVEAGGGHVQSDRLLYRMSLILHSYCPNNDEIVGEENLQTAIAWASNAMGTSIALRNGEKWYVTFSEASVVITKHGDPLANLTRFRGAVTWLMPGMPLGATSSGRVASAKVGRGRSSVHNVNIPPPKRRGAPPPG